MARGAWKLAWCLLLHVVAARVALPDTFKYLPYTEIVTALHALNDARPDIVELFNAQVPHRSTPSLTRHRRTRLGWYPQGPAATNLAGSGLCASPTRRPSQPPTARDRKCFFRAACTATSESGQPRHVFVARLALIRCCDQVTQFATALVSNYDQPTEAQEPWLTRLVESREVRREVAPGRDSHVSLGQIWIMPSANALGYYQGVRTENGIDPNRDFA